MINFENIEGFQWDEGNFDKNPGKHKIFNLEAEQIFFNESLIIAEDNPHSTLSEKRYSALGITEGGKNLAVIFTIRKNLIRIISARQMSKKEKKIIMKKLKKIPKFNSEAEERKFWSNHDTADYFDWTKARKVSFPNLKPSIKSISLRLPEAMLNDLKIIANKKDIPYQSLMKIFISEKIKEEQTH